MGQSNGYGAVTEDGFVGFELKLGEGAWHKVDTKGLTDAKGALAHGVEKLGALALCKLRLARAIAELVGAMAGQSRANALDAAWDRLQDRLEAEIRVKATDEDPEVVAAAGRARSVLLSGDGTEQKSFSYKDEVAFGRKQVRLSATKPFSDDVALLGLGPTIKRIGEATEALSEAVPAGEGGNARARSLQIRAAWAGCVAAFNGAHDDLVWMRDHTAPGAERERVVELLAPFEALLEDHRERNAPTQSSGEKPPVTKPVENKPAQPPVG